MARPISPEVREAIARDLRARWGTTSMRSFARDHGVSDATIRNIASENGLTSDAAREQVEKAASARRATFAQQRAELAQMMLDQAREAIAEIGRGSFVTGVAGGDIICRRVSHTSARDRQALLVAAGIALDKHRMLDQYDADTDTADVAKFLNALGGAVGAAASRPAGEQ